LTPHQVSKLMIQRANKKTNTKGEQQFDDYQQSRILNLAHGANGEGVTLSFYDELALKYFDFQCDFLRYRFPGMSFAIGYIGAYECDFEIDGKGHKDKWDSWKDALKVAAGVKVIHIPEAVTVEEHWAYLDKELDKALKSKEMVHYIAG
jgi:hypothetical protein